MRVALALPIAVLSVCLAAPIREEDRVDVMCIVQAYEDESPTEVRFYRAMLTMTDDDREAYGRTGEALMSPNMTAAEKNQLAQKLFDEHPQTLRVFLAGRGLFQSLQPEVVDFFLTLGKELPLTTMLEGELDRKQLVDLLKKSMRKFQELSEDAKENLKSTFPAAVALTQHLVTNSETEIKDVFGSNPFGEPGASTPGSANCSSRTTKKKSKDVFVLRSA